MAARTTILSFDWRTLQVVQAMAPEIGTVYLTSRQRSFDNIGAGRPGASPWTAGFAYARTRLGAEDGPGRRRAHLVAASTATWMRRRSRRRSALGLQVLAWTVNEPARIERVMDMGVDGIVSDRPDLVREEMRRGRPLPRPMPMTP